VSGIGARGRSQAGGEPLGLDGLLVQQVGADDERALGGEPPSAAVRP
jgi:hypothetical protein